MKETTLAILLMAASVQGQELGAVSGVVTFEETGEPVHGAVVLLIGLGRFETTDGKGRFAIEDVPGGSYFLLVEREHLTADRTSVTVVAEQTVELAVTLSLSPIHEQLTVTTSARGHSTALEQFNAVTSLDSFELAKDMTGNIGEALQNEAGVSKRSFGPAASRPVIRGFDGDRVLIMQDGMRTGDLSSQSGDHSVTIDPANLERIEIIKGPATLLYGTNAVGGVVNTITPQDSFRRSQPQGMRGQAVLDAGTANEQLGGNANLRYGSGRWMFWGGGGARRTADYGTPEGKVENSASQLANASIGMGYYGSRAYASAGYAIEDGRFGVPGSAELQGRMGGEGEFFVDNDQRRQNLRLDLGLKGFSNPVVESARVILQFIDYQHDEVEIEGGVEAIGTSFNNDIFLVRAEVEQQHGSTSSGRFGFWAKNRDYVVTGEEALAPPTVHTALAGFFYEELALGSATTASVGGRVEHNDYDPSAREEVGDGVPAAIPRSFTGLSGSAGLRYDLGDAAALVGNFTSSYRAPALEELYNYGPHLGNLAFEVGNPNLEREKINGLDIGIKGRGSGIDADFNVFYYDINNFVFASIQDEIVDGFRLSEFEQGDSRFVGFDAQANSRLTDHVWLKAGFGFVDAKLSEENENLPRIPPFHGRVEVEILHDALTVSPEIVWSATQNKTFRGETPTDGYVVFNVKAQYTLARTHQAHIFAVNAYNLTNLLYRMHTNFIKDFAPEIGRGIKFTYSLRFF